MKQYEDGYNVNGYSWENETIEYLLNDKQLTDNHIPEWVKKNEIAAFWFWLVIINTDPKLLGVRNELGFNTAMMGLIPAGSIPDNRENITIRLDGHIQSVQGKERYEDEMFIIKYFKKGSAHITFKRLELIDRINDIIARYFPSVLSA